MWNSTSGNLGCFFSYKNVTRTSRNQITKRAEWENFQDNHENYHLLHIWSSENVFLKLFLLQLTSQVLKAISRATFTAKAFAVIFSDTSWQHLEAKIERKSNKSNQTGRRFIIYNNLALVQYQTPETHEIEKCWAANTQNTFPLHFMLLRGRRWEKKICRFKLFKALKIFGWIASMGWMKTLT